MQSLRSEATKGKDCCSHREESVILDSTLESDFNTIMTEMTDKVHDENPKGSFKRVFWDQQLEATKKR